MHTNSNNARIQTHIFAWAQSLPPFHNHAAQSCLAAVFVFLLAAIQYLHQEDKVKNQNKTELGGQGRESTQTGKINEEVYPVICTIN